jgi:hypothetical protein
MSQPRLVARVRHGRGTLARLATTLNPHPVTGFDYRLGDDGVATLAVAVAGSPWDAERVRLRLERVVDVLAVVAEPAQPDGGVGVTVGQRRPRRGGSVILSSGMSPS